MERLLNIFRGDVKWSVESISKSKIFFAAAFKLLKQDFGNAFYVSYTKLSKLFDKPQIKANDHIALGRFPSKG